MKRSIRISLVLTLATAAIAAQAQTQNSPTGPTSTGGPRATNQAGETYPNDPNATNKGKPAAVQKAENSGPAQTTKRVARKAKDATTNTASKGANVVRNAGDNLAKKLPPAPANSPTR